MREQVGTYRLLATVVGGAVIFVVMAVSALDAHGKEPKPPPAAEYVGHAAAMTGSRFVLHIDAFTPDDAAAAIALAGRGGDSSAIRMAFGRLDAGFIKLGTKGYRIAYARRGREDGGVRIIVILRNEMENWETTKMPPFPPLSAVDAWLPDSGDGEATISGIATVVFQSADDVVITDWGEGTLRVFGLREHKH
jgi:hypothetical protein